jgi:hypothetical protein
MHATALLSKDERLFSLYRQEHCTVLYKSCTVLYCTRALPVLRYGIGKSRSEILMTLIRLLPSRGAFVTKLACSSALTKQSRPQHQLIITIL